MTAQLPGDAVMRRNIRSAILRASAAEYAEGKSWYPTAGRLAAVIADATASDVATAGAVIAALSPRNPWAWNVADAYAVLTHAQRPTTRDGNAAKLPRVTTFNSNRDRAISFAAGASDWTSAAPKVRSFVANIMGDYRAVTVDVWAIRCATGGALDAVPSRKGAYQRVADAYRAVAAELGILPAEAQAIAWVVCRNADPRAAHAKAPKRGTAAIVLQALAS